MDQQTLYQFSVRGRQFEIRTVQFAETIQAKCFEDGRDTGVNGSVSVEVASSFAAYGLGSAALIVRDGIERHIRDAIEHGA